MDGHLGIFEKKSKKNRNSSLVTSAIDSKVNIIISIGIILGALLSEFGKSQGFTFLYYFDPIIAIIVSYFIFREVVEIIIVFIKGKDDDIEFEKFQMPYEKNFEEYIVKWILSVYTDHPNEEFTLNSLEETFQHSLTKGKEIYTALSHFGLYIFNDNGISSVIKSLVDESILIETKSNNIKISQRGIYLYENFYSKPLLEDIKDPFDFFFEVDYDFDSIRHRKSDIMESYAKKGEN